MNDIHEQKVNARMKNKRQRVAFTSLICLVVIAIIIGLRALFNYAHVLAGSGVQTVCTAGPPTCDYDNVQDAVDAAANSDIIKIAAGIYTGINNNAGLGQLVYLNKSVTLQGGYTTAFVDPPDPTNNPTILDANGAGRVIFISDVSDATIAGLHLTGGYNNNLDANGAGLAVLNSTIIVRDSWIYSNTATYNWGGGVYIANSSFSLLNNTIINNQAINIGGGITLEQSNGWVVSNTIQNNMSGGVAAFGGVVTFTNNLIAGNTNSYGAGLTINNGDFLVSNNVISGNIAMYQGGGIDVAGGDNILINSNLIIGNEAEGCAGFDLSGSSAVFTNNSVMDNKATEYDGGGGCAGSHNAVLEDNYISGNTAQRYGGGIHAGGPDASTFDRNVFTNNVASCGGGVSFYNGSRTFTNNIVADNQAGAGSGLCIQGGIHTLQHNTFVHNIGGNGIRVIRSSGMSATAFFTNTIVVAHLTGIEVSIDGAVSIEGTLWGSGKWVNGTDWLVVGSGSIMTGTTNIWGDPDFMNPNAQDYHVSPDSPSVDAGVTSTVTWDLDGDLRPAGNGFDIGADESPQIMLLYLPVVLKN